LLQRPSKEDAVSARAWVLAAVVAASACTPPRAAREGDEDVRPPRGGASPGTAAAPYSSPVWAARNASYASLAGMIVGPLAVAQRTGSDPHSSEPTPFKLADAIFLRHAVVDLDDWKSDGTRQVHVDCTFEDVLGRPARETREGILELGPSGEPSFRWLGPPVVTP
jgi:hypothetical protein